MARGSFGLAAAVVFANAARFATNAVVAWWYGPGDHGRFAVVFGLASALEIAAELGIVTTYGVREVARCAARAPEELERAVARLSGALLTVQVVCALALALLAGPLARGLDLEPGLLRLAAIWPVALGLHRLTLMLATGLEATSYAAASAAVYHGAWLACLGLGLAARLSLEGLVAALASVAPVAAAASWLPLYPALRRRRLRLRPTPAGAAATLATVLPSLPYAMPEIGRFALPGVACALAVVWWPQEEASYFQLAFSLAALALLAALPVANALFPALVRELSAGAPLPPGAADGVRASLGGLAATATGVLALYAVFGERLLALVGPAYASQTPVLVVVTAGVAFDAARTLLDRVAMAAGAARRVAAVEIGRYAVFAAAAVVLVPRGAARGLALAVALSMGCGWVASLGLVRRVAGLPVGRESLALAAGALTLSGVAALGDLRWLALPLWGAGAAVLLLRVRAPRAVRRGP